MTFTFNNNTQLNKIIKHTIYTIEKWYELNKLKLNLGKTKIINFNRMIYKENSIILNNTQIKNVNKHTYLGITIDNMLNLNFIPIIFYLNYQKYLLHI